MPGFRLRMSESPEWVSDRARESAERLSLSIETGDDGRLKLRSGSAVAGVLLGNLAARCNFIGWIDALADGSTLFTLTWSTPEPEKLLFMNTEDAQDETARQFVRGISGAKRDSVVSCEEF